MEALRVEEDGRPRGVVALGVDKDLVEIEANVGEGRILELVELVLDLVEAVRVPSRQHECGTAALGTHEMGFLIIS